MAALLNLKSYGRRILRQGSLFEQLTTELAKNERCDRPQLIDYQNQKLRGTIEQAYQIPYYRQLFEQLNLTPKAIKTIDDLQLLPILSKSDIRGKEKQFISKALQWKFKTTTSGTTGTPMTLFRDRYSINFEHASIWRQRHWGKCFADQPYVSIRGNVVAPATATKPPFWRYMSADKKLEMSSYHLSDRFIPYYLEKLRQFKPLFIEGYPSSIYRLARYIQLNQELPIKVKAVFTSSETLPNYKRKAIKECFGQVLDHYGQSERVAHIAMCESGNYHYVMDYSIVEFLPTKEDDLYRVVGTTINNQAMPLIRYDTGDFVRIKDRHQSCSCGRAFPLVESIEGRKEDCIVTPSGKFLVAMGIVFVGVPNIIEGQIIQEKLDSIRILLVASADFTEQDRQVLIKNIQQRVGTDMKIIIQMTADIPRTKRGKHNTTVSLLNHQDELSVM